MVHGPRPNNSLSAKLDSHKLVEMNSSNHKRYITGFIFIILLQLFQLKTIFAECPPGPIWKEALNFAAVTPVEGLKDKSKWKTLGDYLTAQQLDFEQLKSILYTCSKTLDPDKKKCVEPYLQLIKPSDKSKFKLEMSMEDEEYRKKYLTDYLDHVPPVLRDPKFFKELKKGNLEGMYNFTKKLREQPGWLVSQYTNPDFQNTIVVLIPGEDRDFLVQFRISLLGELMIPNSISIIKAKNGKKLERPELIFEGLTLDDPAAGLQMTSLPNQSTSQDRHKGDKPGTPGSCFQCHMGGFVDLVPPKDASEVDKKQAHEINKRLIKLGITKQLGLTRDPDEKFGVSLKFGPPVGPIDPAWRTNEYLKQCAKKGLPPESLDRIRKSMNCMYCHNGNTIKENGLPLDSASLAKAFDWGAYELKPIYWLPGVGLSAYPIKRALINHQSMPPGASLSLDERVSLSDCLLKERNEKFIEMLLPGDCDFFKAESVNQPKDVNEFLQNLNSLLQPQNRQERCPPN